MNLYKYLLSLVLAMGIVTSLPLFADDDDNHHHEGNEAFEEALNQRDILALKEYINSKRTIDVEVKANNLTVSGDVRAGWRHINEKIRGVNVTGGDGAKSKAVNDAGRPSGRNKFDVVFNAYFDYVAENAWAVTQVQYDNSAGVDGDGKTCDEVEGQGWNGSGECEDVCLRKAYMGYSFFGDYYGMRLDIEVGRRSLYNSFDSNIQFLSRFDGVLVKFTNNYWDCVGNFYVKWAGFVVDQKVNHFAWAVETGLLDIAHSGFDLKYSFIDWVKKGENRCGIANPLAFQFRNSQVTAAYNIDSCYLYVPVRLYGAYLYNHYDNHTFTDRNKRHGYYAGFMIGEVMHEGDFSFEIEYQCVQANAIPNEDISGISTGNIPGNNYISDDGLGNTNYRGWRFEALYALTDNLNIDTRVQCSQSECSKIGGTNNYSEFRIQAIYAY